MNKDSSFAASHNTESAAEGGGSFLGHLWASVAATVLLTIICCGVYPLIVWGVAQAVFPGKANGSLVTKDGKITSDDKAPNIVGSSLIGQNFSLAGYLHPRPSQAGSGYDPTSSGGSNLGPLSDQLINGVTIPAAGATAESLKSDGIRLRTLHFATDNGFTFKLYSMRSDDFLSGEANRPRTEVPLSKFIDGQGNLVDIALVDAFPHAGDAPERMVMIAEDFKDTAGNPLLIPGDAVTSSGSGLDPHISPRNAELQTARVAAARNVTPDKVKAVVEANTDRPDLGILGDPGVNVLMVNLALDAKYPLPPTPPAPATQPASTTPPAAAAVAAPATQPAVSK